VEGVDEEVSVAVEFMERVIEGCQCGEFWTGYFGEGMEEDPLKNECKEDD